MTNLQSNFAQQIQAVISEYGKTVAEYQEGHEFSDEKYFYFLTKFEALLLRVTNKESSYYNNFVEAKKINYSGYDRLPTNKKYRLNAIQGILVSLKIDLTSGYFESYQELIHASFFSDFLEMAEHLLEEGYKDPAAVIIGSTLEEHLKKLSQKSGIAIESLNTKGQLKPKKADFLNSELVSGNTYSKLDQKSVTAWLGLRNDAAHGNYSGYTKDQVVLMLQGVRDFITRNPA